MAKIKPCPICHRPFEPGKVRRTTCSEACADIFSTYGYKQRAELVEAAEACRKPPLTDCKIYHDNGHPTCSGLTALWCEWEECKFYRPSIVKRNLRKRK